MPELATVDSRQTSTGRRPPYRADQVGSLLRPPALLEAREKHKDGQISREDLVAVEDAAIRDVVRRQEDIGLHAITDGDFRRSSFHIDFLTQIDGITWQPSSFLKGFTGGIGAGHSPAVFATTAPIRHTKPIAVSDFRFLADVTTRTPKVTLPSPSFAHCRGGRAAIDETVYPDLDLFFHDLAAAYRDELTALSGAGCTYVQLDEVHFAFLCDPKLVDGFLARGDDPDVLARTYAALINESVAGRSPDMSVCVHLCRGNHRSSWVAEGGYEPVAELLFNEVDVDGFFLEYDSDRSGGFAPLRFVPPGKQVVLGLVSSKTGEMESADVLKRRIDEAAQYVPLDQLALSPQCGFASSVPGNKITADDQWRKLELVVQVAEEVWGSAK